ncbi:MAG: 2OG-Fe(II) oxygenase [Pseudomonadales bacterium]|nr:2OG-Fe(II) oxygenase [Pseudomonadales bacterium]
MTQSILHNLSSDSIDRNPFPHLILRNAIEPTLYAELERNLPSMEMVAGPGQLKNNHAYRLGAENVIHNPDIAPVWREFFDYHTSEAYFRELVEFWRRDVADYHPGLTRNYGKALDKFSVGRRDGRKSHAQDENTQTDVVLDCMFVYNSPVQAVSSVRGPHVDSGRKLYSAILYMRSPEDDSTGGSLELDEPSKGKLPLWFRKRTPHRYVNKVKELPYESNTLMIWLNSWRSLHAVTPRSITPHPRRYVVFTAECYGGKVEDFFTRMPKAG